MEFKLAELFAELSARDVGFATSLAKAKEQAEAAAVQVRSVSGAVAGLQENLTTARLRVMGFSRPMLSMGGAAGRAGSALAGAFSPELGQAIQSIARLITWSSTVMAGYHAASRFAAASTVTLGAATHEAGNQIAAAGAKAAVGWVGILGPIALVIIAVAGVVAIIKSLTSYYDKLQQKAKEAWRAMEKVELKAADALKTIHADYLADLGKAEDAEVERAKIRAEEKRRAVEKTFKQQISAMAKAYGISRRELTKEDLKWPTKERAQSLAMIERGLQSRLTRIRADAADKRRELEEKALQATATLWGLVNKQTVSLDRERSILRERDRERDLTEVRVQVKDEIDAAKDLYAKKLGSQQAFQSVKQGIIATGRAREAEINRIWDEKERKAAVEAANKFEKQIRDLAKRAWEEHLRERQTQQRLIEAQYKREMTYVEKLQAAYKRGRQAEESRFQAITRIAEQLAIAGAKGREVEPTVEQLVAFAKQQAAEAEQQRKRDEQLVAAVKAAGVVVPR